MHRAPAEIGISVDDVDTPALLIDLDAFEANLQTMSARASTAGVRLRPHAKTHKCAVIGLRQMALGAVGVCCQKVSEAEALVDAGVSNVLVSNQVVGPRKLSRLAALARRAKISACVDDAMNIVEMGRAAQAAGSEIGVLVEINVGANRCGVQPGAPAVQLAQLCAQTDGIKFEGLQAYQGSAQHKRTFAEREQAIAKAVAWTGETVEALAAAGLSCETVGGAGTGTFEFEAQSGVYNELQPGSYIFMDADYARNLDLRGEPIHDWRHSLFVLATVMSRPNAATENGDCVVVDVGHKAVSGDSGPPTVWGDEEAEYHRPSDEHGVIRFSGANQRPALGAKIRLVPGHCDPTVNLHDWYVGVRGDRVEALWPIVARGAIF